MTKDHYLEMCLNLGNDPIVEEIPIELDDLTVQSQEVIEIFNYFTDEWSDMGGYLGKNLSNFPVIFDLYGVPKNNWLLYLDLLGVLIQEQVKIVNTKISKESKKGAIKSAK